MRSQHLNRLNRSKLNVAGLLVAGVVCFWQSTQSADAQAQGVDWMTLGSTYTHSPVDGQRVDRFAEPVQPLAANRSDFVRSGYRNFRSSLQAGGLADNYNVVEQWGNPIQPYGEWRFPFRPYSAPYPAWGPQPVPFGGVPIGGGLNPYGAVGGFPGGYGNAYGGAGYGPGSGFPGSGAPGNGPNSQNPYLPGAPSPTQPAWYDGAYPDYPLAPLPSDQNFYDSPNFLPPTTNP